MATMKNASAALKGKFRTRFEDADEDGFLAADEFEVSEIGIDYRRQQGIQRGINRKILVAAARRQIEDAVHHAFGFGVFLDKRGRLYYHGAGIAPQSKDFGKGALMAAEPRRLGISGLKFLLIGVATTLGWNGIDKEGMRKRVAAVVKLIRGGDPKGRGGKLLQMVTEARQGTGYMWRTAEEPMQFLALASDLLSALSSGNAFNYKSGVFVGMDATCSGLQILAAVTGDLQTALEVNVMPRPDGKRADIYLRGGEALLARCQEIVDSFDAAQAADAEVYLAIVEEAEAERRAAIEEGRKPDPEVMQAAKDVPPGDHWALYWVRRGVTRKLMKGPVMVFCYGGGKRTFAGAFAEESRAPWKACYWLAAVLYDEVLPVLLPKAYAFMLALQEAARTLAKLGKPIEFEAADGFPFLQAVHETEEKRVRCHLHDSRSLYVVLQSPLPTLSVQRQASGVAPNIVHHWDSLYLRNVVRALADAGIDTFYTVHDCFYLRPGDWAKGWKILREVFVETFQGDVAREVWQKIEDRANGLDIRHPEVEGWENEGGACAREEEVSIVRLGACPERGDLDLSAALRSEFLFS